MKEQWVTITMEVPLDDIYFGGCGDGDKEIYGLNHATFGDHAIRNFAASDVGAATVKMKADLGYKEPRLNVDQRVADLMAFIAEERSRFRSDPVSKAKEAR